ncbi:hypothetical protein Tco_1345538 [Tanacetum coccineum]
MPHDSPLRGGHTPGSDEGSITLHELTVLCIILSNKVKKLEQTVKTSLARRRSKILVSDDEEDEEDPSKQGRSLIEEMDLDAGISLVPPHVEVQNEQNLDSTVAQVSTASTFVITSSPQRNADTTPNDLTLAETLMEIRKSVAKAKELAQKLHEEEQARFNVEQEAKFDIEVAQKLQEEFDATERQRMAQVHQVAQGFTDAEWDDVLARVAADEDFTREASGSGEKQSAEKEKEISEEELQKLLVIVPVEEVYIEALQVKYPIIDCEVYSKDTRRDDLVKLWDLVKERFSTTEPTDDKEKALWVELKRLFEPNNDDTL